MIVNTVQAVDAMQSKPATDADLLTSLLRTISDSIYLHDLETNRIEFINRRTFLGYNTSALTAASLYEMIHPDDRESEYFDWHTLLASDDNVTRSAVLRMHSQSGEWEWVRQQITVSLRSADGTPQMVLVSLAIITDQIDSERALMRNEQKFRSITTNNTDAFLVIDRDGVVVFCNPAAEMMFDRPAAQLIGKPFGLPVVTGDRGELEIVRGDLVLIAETHVVEIVWDDQPMLLASLRDVTRRRKAEDALRESEARFRQIADHIHEIFYIYDVRQAAILYVSPAYEQIWQRSRELLFRDPLAFLERVHPDDRADLAGIYSDRSRQVYEYRIVRDDGKVRWITTRQFPIVNKHNEVYRIAGVSQDVTERRLAAEKSVELAMERETVRMLSNFVRSASHEFRTPLSTISASTYLLTRLDDPEKRNLYRRKIDDQISNITTLLDALVLMARLDTRPQLAFETLDLNIIAAAVVYELQPVAEAHAHTLIFEPESGLPRISGAVEELQVAVRHLVENAIVYTVEPGQIMVQTEKSSGTVDLIVEDTGIGIDNNHLPYIFERFYRVDTSHHISGFGLGLAITQKVIEAHQGTIHVTSVPGQGSRFIIRLPV